MKIKIMSDSTCDLSKELLDKYDISIVPLYIIMGDKIKKDGEEVFPEEIYDYVEESGNLPKTSAVNINDYIEAFKYWREQGYEIVHFCISSEFSVTYQNACIAAQETGGVYVVDSRNLSTGQGVVVMHGAEMAQSGCTAEEIVKSCSEIVPKVEVGFVIDSIDYLHKGGRCSAVAAFGANLLNFKPCIEVVDGKMNTGKKYRGNISKVMLEYIVDRLKDRNDIDKRRIFITHTRCSEEDVMNVRKKVLELMPDCGEIIENIAGCTITSHCGPNTMGLLLIRK